MSEKKGPPTYDVRVDGQDIPEDARASVIAVAADLWLEAADYVAVTLENDRSRWSDSPLFKPGKKLAVSLGYGERRSKVFDGEITALRARYPRRGPSQLVVEATARYHRLKRGRLTRAFTDVSDSDVVSQVAQGCGLKADVDATDTRHEHVFQHNETNLEFLVRLSERSGFELDCNDGTISFKKAKLEAAKTLALTWGQDLISFRPRIVAEPQFDQVEVRGWSILKETVLGKAGIDDAGPDMGGRVRGPQLASRAFGSATTRGTREVQRSVPTAAALAKAQIQRRTLRTVKAEGTCEGEPRIAPGKVVEIAGVGEIVSGSYYVCRVVHDLLPHGFSTTFQARRTAIEQPAKKDKIALRIDKAVPPRPPREVPQPKDDEPSTFLEVLVKDPDGNPIPGELVRLLADGKAPADGRLTGEGHVRFNDLKPGAYKVQLPELKLDIHPAAADAPPVQPPREPRLIRARWAKPVALCGETVAMSAHAVEIPPGTEASFKVYRRYARGPGDTTAVVPAKVAPGGGVEAVWNSLVIDDAEIERIQKEGFKAYEFYFVVEAGDARARSGLLDLRDFIAVEVLDTRDRPLANKRYRLTFPTGEETRGRLGPKGELRHDAVPPGPYDLRVFPDDAPDEELDAPPPPPPPAPPPGKG